MARWTFAATQTTLDSVSAQAPNSLTPYQDVYKRQPASLAAETARPGERTAAYYASRPCERCIAFCARSAAELEAKARHHENTRPPLQGNRAL